MAPAAEVASAAQRKTADHAPSLALTGSRPPVGGLLLSLEQFLSSAAEFTMVTICCRLCHPLAQEFTMVMRAGDSLSAVRKALGAVEGGGPGRMAGDSPTPHGDESPKRRPAPSSMNKLFAAVYAIH